MRSGHKKLPGYAWGILVMLAGCVLSNDAAAQTWRPPPPHRQAPRRPRTRPQLPTQTVKPMNPVRQTIKSRVGPSSNGRVGDAKPTNAKSTVRPGYTSRKTSPAKPTSRMRPGLTPGFQSPVVNQRTQKPISNAQPAGVKTGRKYWSRNMANIYAKKPNVQRVYWSKNIAAKYKPKVKPKESLLQKLSARQTTSIFVPGKPGAAVTRTQYRLGGFSKSSQPRKVTKQKKDLWKSWSRFWKKQFDGG